MSINHKNILVLALLCLLFEGSMQQSEPFCTTGPSPCTGCPTGCATCEYNFFGERNASCLTCDEGYTHKPSKSFDSKCSKNATPSSGLSGLSMAIIGFVVMIIIMGICCFFQFKKSRTMQANHSKMANNNNFNMVG